MMVEGERGMTRIKKIRSSMAVNIIGAIILLLVIFGIIVSVLGFISFNDAFVKEYSTTTYHMAGTATTLVRGDGIDAYLSGEETEEYQQTKKYLDAYCKRMNVSLVYVIKVDTSDYGRFVSVFNSVNNSVDNTSYTEWEIGHKRDTTNEEYRQKYKAIYAQETSYETVFRKKPGDGSHPHITTMVPVKNSDGEVTAILCIQRPIHELEEAMRPYLINIGISTFMLAVLSTVFVAVYIKYEVVSPISKVSEEAARFAKENTKGEELGEISKFEQIANLANSIDTMETDMVNYMENLTAITAERERIGVELSFARMIQEASVPNTFPAFPDRSDFDIYATMTPAKEVGGDFYNFFFIDNDHLALVIGDVSGKGVPAALFMMVTNIVLSDSIKMGGTPAETLNFANDNICEHNTLDMFVTLWVGILELSTGRIVAANAGHEDAAVYRKDGSFELFKTKHDIVAGVLPGILYRDFEFRLEPGDKLFLYTDGVPEATDQNNNMFTIGRMLDSLNENKEKTPQEILCGVHARVNKFVGNAPQFDDLTMLCIELKEHCKTTD